MDRRVFNRLGFGVFSGLFAATSARADEPTKNRAVFQVSSEDRRLQAMALGNVHNYAAHYKAKGEPFAVEIVAFGPGFSMLRDEMSMVKGNVENLAKDLGPALTISACQNTRKAVAENEGKKPEDIPLLPGVKETPSGVVRLAELQNQGWAYIRP